MSGGGMLDDAEGEGSKLLSCVRAEEALLARICACCE